MRLLSEGRGGEVTVAERYPACRLVQRRSSDRPAYPSCSIGSGRDVCGNLEPDIRGRSLDARSRCIAGVSLVPSIREPYEPQLPPSQVELTDSRRALDIVQDLAEYAQADTRTSRANLLWSPRSTPTQCARQRGEAEVARDGKNVRRTGRGAPQSQPIRAP